MTNVIIAKLNPYPMTEKQKAKELPRCHVCGNDKEPYEIYIKGDVFSIMEHEKQHKEARKGGEICKRCNSYHAMTGILKEPTEEEFNGAKQEINNL